MYLTDVDDVDDDFRIGGRGEEKTGDKWRMALAMERMLMMEDTIQHEAVRRFRAHPSRISKQGQLLVSLHFVEGLYHVIHLLVQLNLVGAVRAVGLILTSHGSNIGTYQLVISGTAWETYVPTNVYSTYAHIHRYD